MNIAKLKVPYVTYKQPYAYLSAKFDQNRRRTVFCNHQSNHPNLEQVTCASRQKCAYFGCSYISKTIFGTYVDSEGPICVRNRAVHRCLFSESLGTVEYINVYERSLSHGEALTPYTDNEVPILPIHLSRLIAFHVLYKYSSLRCLEYPVDSDLRCPR